MMRKWLVILPAIMIVLAGCKKEEEEEEEGGGGGQGITQEQAAQIGQTQAYFLSQEIIKAFNPSSFVPSFGSISPKDTSVIDDDTLIIIGDITDADTDGVYVNAQIYVKYDEEYNNPGNNYSYYTLIKGWLKSVDKNDNNPYVWEITLGDGGNPFKIQVDFQDPQQSIHSVIEYLGTMGANQVGDTYSVYYDNLTLSITYDTLEAGIVLDWTLKSRVTEPSNWQPGEEFTSAEAWVNGAENYEGYELTVSTLETLIVVSSGGNTYIDDGKIKITDNYGNEVVIEYTGGGNFVVYYNGKVIS